VRRIAEYKKLRRRTRTDKNIGHRMVGHVFRDGGGTKVVRGTTKTKGAKQVRARNVVEGERAAGRSPRCVDRPASPKQYDQPSYNAR